VWEWLGLGLFLAAAGLCKRSGVQGAIREKSFDWEYNAPAFEVKRGPAG